MQEALYIIVDDDLSGPVYADPRPEDLDPDVWDTVARSVYDAFEGEGPASGSVTLDDMVVSWHLLKKFGISFVSVVDAMVTTQQNAHFLKALSQVYLDEVDQPRRPERNGVEDIVCNVIPPWDE